ncbi:hypothetical protein BOC40_06560 [Burkholderia pseudomallei]|nr:hypothetical protein BOC40_06560 [Burkholderia pseudomallei]ARL46291.1 hypothetical protein BOC50_25340 [Burkholderia pseudomallei]
MRELVRALSNHPTGETASMANTAEINAYSSGSAAFHDIDGENELKLLAVVTKLATAGSKATAVQAIREFAGETLSRR